MLLKHVIKSVRSFCLGENSIYISLKWKRQIIGEAPNVGLGCPIALRPILCACEVLVSYNFTWIARLVAWLAIVALAVASWTPGEEMVRTGLNTRLEHVIAYLLAASAFMFAYPNQKAWQVGLAFVTYAGILELGQLIVPGRHAAVLDWTAGTIGALAGCGLWAGWRVSNLSRRA